jgi:hypothetical protein
MQGGIKNTGELAEWLNAAVLKTVKDASPSGVRIPDSPHKGLVERKWFQTPLSPQDADFDIIIVTSRKISWQEERNIYVDVFRVGLDNDIQFDIKFFSEEEITVTHRQMPFLKNVLSYGITV